MNWVTTYSTLFSAGRVPTEQWREGYESEFREAFGPHINEADVIRACRSLSASEHYSERYPPTAQHIIERIRMVTTNNADGLQPNQVFARAMADIRNAKNPAHRWSIICDYELRYGAKDKCPYIGRSLEKACRENHIEVERYEFNPGELMIGVAEGAA